MADAYYHSDGNGSVELLGVLDVPETVSLQDMEESSDTSPLKGDFGKNYGSSASPDAGFVQGGYRRKERWMENLVAFFTLASLQQRWTNLRQSVLSVVRRKVHPIDRIIHSNDPDANYRHRPRFCSNRISTTKYNLASFIPLFLWDQFTRLANVFFLITSLLQQIPDISPTGRYTTIVPLILVLLATAVKEIIEDFKRYIADNKVNNRKVRALRGGSLTEVYWTKVVVGDIVFIENKEFFPADLLVLSTSEPQGLCYIETSNLDGETNLKIRQAHPKTMHMDDPEQLRELRASIQCEGPNNRLYEFTGNLEMEGQRLEPIISDQILLRGAMLRNTEWVCGMVIYTGHDTKLFQNTTRPPLKRSNMDSVINRQIILLFLILLAISLLSSIGAVVWNEVTTESQYHWYLQVSDRGVLSKFLEFLKSIVTFIILYNNLIPISLIVTLEVVKFIQVFFINFDLDMYDESTDTPALGRNSNLNEELGQVQYIFSDKTGTLTENIMEFKKCTVSGQIYGIDPTSSMEESYPMLGLHDAIQGLRSHPSDEFTLIKFFKVLALCHTVIPEREDSGVVYRASSPDEGALVRAAKELGVVLEQRTPNSVVIDVIGKKEEYEVLNLLEFNSIRKRMSVIVRTPDGTIKLFCKGADTVIYERLQESEPFAAVTEKQLEHFALDGLRTLCVAESTIDEAQYNEWSKLYYAASIATTDREKELDKAAELVEKNLHLLGATAIEDKLQPGVPESIAALRRANIKVWVLTGDKQETAINIGYASRQLTESMRVCVINETTLEAVEARLKEYSTVLGAVSRKKREHNAAVVIDGKSLAFALDKQVCEQFLSLALTCKSVICCRVTPLQKADIVRLVRSKVKNSITLAIGDGANDVSMIQAAHVGVGISGKEGLQATLASDYAIGQFRFLVKLLLVHGAWNYNRLAKLILFFFYKNIILYILEFWFSFVSGFSGQTIFERWSLTCYNVVFTSFPPIVLGLMNKDVSSQGRLRTPTLYKHSQERRGLNAMVFWKRVALAFLTSLVLFCIVYFILFKSQLLFEDGKVFGLWYVGDTLFTTVVITVCLKAAMELESWNWVAHILIWGSIASWFIFIVIMSHVWPVFPIGYELVGQDVNLFRSLTYYALIVLAPAICLMPDFLWTSVQQTVWPTELDYVREREILAERKGQEDYESLEGLVISYDARSAAATGYGDGFDEEETSLTYGRGYAFSQEDHGHVRTGSSKVQRREVIRMYDTTHSSKL